MNKLQILERLKSQGVDRSVWPLFLLLFPSVFSLCNAWHISSVPLPWYRRRNCEIIIMITLKAIALFFQAVARVNSVGYNSMLFCWYLANFGKLLKSVNDVNMTRTMSHDPQQKKALKLLRILCFLFVLAASVTSCLTDAQRNGIHFLMRKRKEVKIGGSEMFLLIFFLAREDLVPPLPPSPPPHKTRNQSIDPVKR